MIGLAPYIVAVATMAAIYAVAALGLNLQFGVAGLFNVGCAAFVAVGAYASAIVTGLPAVHALGAAALPIGIAAAAAAAALLAALVGTGLLRLRGDTLAIATFGMAAAVQLGIGNLASVTGGANGYSGIALRLGESGANGAWLLVCAGVAAALWLALWRLDRGAWGRTLRAVSEDPEAAAALGKNVAACRMQAFVAGSALMGVAGSLMAHNAGFISPQDFQPVLTFQLYAMVVVGGTGRHGGAVLGAAVVWAIWSISGQALAAILPPQAQSASGAIRMIGIAALLIAVLLVRPQGLLPEQVGPRRRRADGTKTAMNFS